MGRERGGGRDVSVLLSCRCWAGTGAGGTPECGTGGQRGRRWWAGAGAAETPEFGEGGDRGREENNHISAAGGQGGKRGRGRYKCDSHWRRQSGLVSGVLLRCGVQALQLLHLVPLHYGETIIARAPTPHNSMHTLPSTPPHAHPSHTTPPCMPTSLCLSSSARMMVEFLRAAAAAATVKQDSSSTQARLRFLEALIL